MSRNTVDDKSNGHLDLATPPPAQARGSSTAGAADPLASLAGTLMDVNDQYNPASVVAGEATVHSRTQPQAFTATADQALINSATALLSDARARIRAEPRTAIAIAAIAGALIATALRLGAAMQSTPATTMPEGRH